MSIVRNSFVTLTPLLQNDLLRFGTGLGSNELLQVADGVVRIAFDTHFLAQTVVTDDFDHDSCGRCRSLFAKDKR